MNAAGDFSRQLAKVPQAIWIYKDAVIINESSRLTNMNTYIKILLVALQCLALSCTVFTGLIDSIGFIVPLTLIKSPS